MRRHFAAAFVIAATTSATAHADSRSWNTVKGMLPDNVNVVMGANVSALRATSLYGSLVPNLIAKEPDVKQAFELAKSTCAIDLNTAITDATIAMGDDERGIVVAAVDKSTIDQKRVVTCLEKVLAATVAVEPTPAEAPPKADPTAGGLKRGAKGKTDLAKDPPKTPAAKPVAPKLVVKTTGKITEYGVDTDSKRLYVAWLAPDVIAIATDPDDRALLEKMLAGKGAKGAITGLLPKANPSSTVWLAATKQQEMPTGGTMKGAFGSIDAAKGNVSMDMSIIMSSAKDAKAIVDQVTALLASAKKAIPPQLQKLVDALQLTSANDTTRVKLTASEKDVLGLLMMAMMNL